MMKMRCVVLLRTGRLWIWKNIHIASWYLPWRPLRTRSWISTSAEILEVQVPTTKKTSEGENGQHSLKLTSPIVGDEKIFRKLPLKSCVVCEGSAGSIAFTHARHVFLKYFSVSQHISMCRTPYLCVRVLSCISSCFSCQICASSPFWIEHNN